MLAFEALFDSALANFLSTTRNPERGYRQEGFSHRETWRHRNSPSPFYRHFFRLSKVSKQTCNGRAAVPFRLELEMKMGTENTSKKGGGREAFTRFVRIVVFNVCYLHVVKFFFCLNMKKKKDESKCNLLFI